MNETIVTLACKYGFISDSKYIGWLGKLGCWMTEKSVAWGIVKWIILIAFVVLVLAILRKIFFS